MKKSLNYHQFKGLWFKISLSQSWSNFITSDTSAKCSVTKIFWQINFKVNTKIAVCYC
jgi:hypothetical protein